MIEIDELLAEATESPPCGPDLEYDAGWLELEQAARGKAEQQFGETVIPAEEANWEDVSNRAATLLRRSKDLRVAALLARGLLHVENFAGLKKSLDLFSGLLDRYWEGVHPVLDASDNNDPTMRVNALSPLVDPDGLLRDLRESLLVRSRALGQLSVRQIEVALGKIPPRKGEEPSTQAQVESMLSRAAAEDPGLPALVAETHAQAKGLVALITDKFGPGIAPDFKPLMTTLYGLDQVMKRAVPTGDPSEAGAGAGGEGDPAGANLGAPQAAISGAIRSRQDVLQVLDKVCEFLERTEPSHPAPLLIQRARRLLEMNFMDIIRDMASGGMSQIETITGIKSD